MVHFYWVHYRIIGLNLHMQWFCASINWPGHLSLFGYGLKESKMIMVSAFRKMSAFRKILAVPVKSLNLLAFPGKPLLICVLCCIFEKEIRLPEDYTVLSLEHSRHHDYVKRSLIPTQDECVTFRGAFFTKRWCLPLKLEMDVPIHPMTDPNKLFDGPGA